MFVVSHDDVVVENSERGLLFLDSNVDLDEAFLPKVEKEGITPVLPEIAWWK